MEWTLHECSYPSLHFSNHVPLTTSQEFATLQQERNMQYPGFLDHHISKPYSFDGIKIFPQIVIQASFFSCLPQQYNPQKPILL